MWRSVQSSSLGSALICVLAWSHLMPLRLGAQEVSPPKLGATGSLCSPATEQGLQPEQSENASLREQLADCRQSIIAWCDNAAEANAEAELFRRQYDSLKLRMEALGLATIGETRDLLEQRLLGSVRDLDLARRQNQALSERLLALSEAVLRNFRAGDAEDEGQSRLEVEAELRATSEVIGKPVKAIISADAIPTNLKLGLVLGYKEDLSLLVTNFGSAQGVKVGMPITVARGDSFIGRARVVQVRERISGATFEQNYPSGKQVKVGDQVRVNAF